ncbi:MAG TPA: V-type ATP synthase subunit E [Planctomycetota bacterium]|nr:V-type ATP synthase subunit E [Planctomycetota bacterium]
MSVDRIKTAILSEAGKEAERIRTAGRKKADEKFRAAEHQLTARLRQRLQDAEQHQRDLANRGTVTLRSQLSMELLAAKNELVDKVVDKALDNVVNLPNNGYRVLLMKWLKNAPQGEPGELVLNERDRKAFGQQLVSDLNRVRAKEAALVLGQQALPIRGGFVLRTERYEIDRTLDSLIVKLKEEMAPEIASQLFGSRTERAEAS